MAVVKITDLPAATIPLSGTELTPIVQNGITKKVAVDAIGDKASVKTYGAIGDGIADDTAAIQAACTALDAVFFPSGTYKITSPITLKSNNVIYGDGASSVILYTGTATSQGALYANSGSSSTYVENLVVQNIKILGTVASAGFNEFIHLISFNGVRNCLIDSCEIVGFRGDGIYIGSGDIGGQERHNIDVTITNCYIDGVNNDNRNGISVIDGNGITIENNYFNRCTRSNMPGAIDVEPDAGVFYPKTGNLSLGSAIVTNIDTSGLLAGMAVLCANIPLGTTIASIDSPTQLTLSTGVGVTAAAGIAIQAGYFANFKIIKNISIRNNRIYDCRGNVGAITIFLPIQTYTTPPNGFVIENNYIDIPNAPNDNTYGIFFEFGNPFASPKPIPAITESTPNLGVRILNNYIKFPNVGPGRAFVVWNINDAIIADNQFVGGAVSLIGFPGTNVLDLSLINNSFTSTNGAGNFALSVFTGSRIKFEGNVFKDCGAPSGAARGAIEFNTGTTSYVDIINNVFVSPNGSFTQQAIRDAGHTFTAATNRFVGNSVISGANQFVADIFFNNNPITTNNNIPNLGIGTNPTTYPLTVSSGAANAALFQSNNGVPQITATDGTVTQLVGYISGSLAYHGTGSNHNLGLLTNNVERLLINTSGDVGINSTPQLWNASATALQITDYSCFATDSTNRPIWTNNAYQGTDGNYRYIQNGIAMRYRMNTSGSQMDWGFAPSGTAQNTFSFTTHLLLDSGGRMALVPTGVTDSWAKWRVGGTLPTSSNQSVASDARYVVPSGTTSFCLGYQSFASTEAASFTLTSLKHYNAEQGTFGAGSAVTSQAGFYADSSLTGATNNYGFYGNIASGSNRFNLYMAGTATNYLEGNTGVGTASPSEKLEVNGAIKTAAPSGGTAAAWKLGAVATVSPTAPNRTIEVDIGGTIYYIHAKTTNN